jgi:arylsulfatase A-like enzyme
MLRLSRLPALSLTIVIAYSGCAPGVPRIVLHERVARPDRFVVMFFVDGLDPGRLQGQMASGGMPQVRRWFVDGGVEVRHAVSSVPAMTYPNTVSLMTGMFPGHHGVTGNQWFDRRRLEWSDYITLGGYLAANGDFACPTLYEMLPGRMTVNVQCTVRRGADHDVDTRVPTGLAWAVGLHESVDQYVAGCVSETAGLATRHGRWPDLVVFYFPGLDEAGHVHGPDSPAYERGLRNIDAQVGRVLEALQAAGLGDRMYGVLVSDHGHLATRGARRADVVGGLRAMGLRVHQGPVAGADAASRERQLSRFDAVVVDGSSRRMEIHLRGPGRWSEQPARAVVERIIGRSGAPGGLRGMEGVGMVCTRQGAGRVRVDSRRGSAWVERRVEGPRRLYRMRGADVTGYGVEPELRSFVEAGWHESREWLAATAASRYPDFVPQIVEYFDAPRRGDLLVFAADGWFFSGAAAGGHGGPQGEDMRIPLYFFGPGLPRGGKVACGRLVDVAPTVVEILHGESWNSQRGRGARRMDGESLLAALREAGR